MWGKAHWAWAGVSGREGGWCWWTAERGRYEIGFYPMTQAGRGLKFLCFFSNCDNTLFIFLPDGHQFFLAPHAPPTSLQFFLRGFGSVPE